MKIINKTKRKIWVIGVVLFLAVSGLQNAAAQDEGKWQYQFTLYGWYSDLNADYGLPYGPGPGKDITIDASDIIANLNMIFMGMFEARKDKWALLADVIYLDVGDDKEQTLFPPDHALPVHTSVDFNMSTWVISGAPAMM